MKTAKRFTFCLCILAEQMDTFLDIRYKNKALHAFPSQKKAQCFAVLYFGFRVSLPVFIRLCRRSRLPDAGDELALLGKQIVHRLHGGAESGLFFFVQLRHLNACRTHVLL